MKLYLEVIAIWFLVTIVSSLFLWASLRIIRDTTKAILGIK
jgi:hypothetical protein